ncbi:MAG: ankyrin repeat domain-containing protein [Treponema sp.]|nr:ankyrin repeat domain-containing protein [Treponema sp.]
MSMFFFSCASTDETAKDSAGIGAKAAVAIDENGNTPLMSAVLRNSDSAIDAELSRSEYLADNAKFLNHANSDGNNALHLAAIKRNRNLAKRLLKMGIDRNAVNNDGDTALHIAVKNSDSQLVDALLDGGCDTDALDGEGATPLILAARNGNGELVQKLISRHADTKIKDGMGKVYSEYLSAKADEKKPKHGEDSKFERHAPKSESNSAIEKPAAIGKGFSIRFGLKRNPVIDAVRNGDRLSLDKAVDAGENVNSKDEFGNSALFYALKASDFSIFRRLLDLGANSGTRNNDGQTPLMYAVFQNADNFALALLKNGASPSTVDDDGNSALSIAISNSSVNLVSALLEAGANPNITFADGNTALIQMVYNDDLPCAKAFLARVPEYDVWQTNVYGKTALDVAKEKHNMGFVKLLESYQ